MWQFYGRARDQRVNARTRAGRTAHHAARSPTPSFRRSTGSAPPRFPVKGPRNGRACLVPEGRECHAAGFSTAGLGGFRLCLSGFARRFMAWCRETALARDAEPSGSGLLPGISVALLACDGHATVAHDFHDLGAVPEAGQPVRPGAGVCGHASCSGTGGQGAPRGSDPWHRPPPKPDFRPKSFSGRPGTACSRSGPLSRPSRDLSKAPLGASCGMSREGDAREGAEKRAEGVRDEVGPFRGAVDELLQAFDDTAEDDCGE